ncbi:hypothetical protein IW139_001862 [Coemansia sp. RSA 353]|nr:hypothetical protein GGH15_002312 [Coemansia sp. RSA 562]KAJ2207861.1 hypothetical protein IW145_001157 [Coemansia sp. RSA 521]KAJ2224744.1 hypothetical protein EV180_003575 [Coemansia sp. RSA 518]KAJ2277640.1 hypothetical protein J3F81_000852 [Coemansia sp. RSA 371]KAJ2281971.1 hypothetical protein GGH14_001832 [Coemansia sp. RSA 370]KAJ2299192.1 hypothetical protein IW139_001862 [Coemansia sp. RSA 353]KAJ2430077.1 hypothetical protein IWW41_003321 [Coemansia sp. RSA 2522]KAJ2531257.1 hy
MTSSNPSGGGDDCTTNSCCSEATDSGSQRSITNSTRKEDKQPNGDYANYVIRTNERTGTATIVFESEEDVLAALQKKVIVNGQEVIAQRPIRCTEYLAFVHVTLTAACLPVTAARKAAKLMELYGIVEDVCIRMVDAHTPLDEITVVLDRTGNEGEIPHKLYLPGD